MSRREGVGLYILLVVTWVVIVLTTPWYVSLPIVGMSGLVALLNMESLR